MEKNMERSFIICTRCHIGSNVRVINSRRITWAGHESHMGEMINA